MNNSEKQKLLEILKLADERYGAYTGSQDKVEFTLSQAESAGIKIQYYVMWDIGLAEGWERILFGFERLRERAGLKI
ncbi:hypothetical protein KKI90_01735 [Xenorhabdus bovienii]|uniref:hypothetical protein n=1 Tax=Xenorhabdus bovienii TaxID=40576 RepID=UPI00237CCDCC|nr:hypothetical protein [Xenorhabdus bovienii]MDE1485176.1 hypothetical protein [Xenorhabdus bovienii]MDE9477998.1 hypothetical protein [Xenorhabdus bovienii]MDE9492891.1 hypothetical protein [Xenorhabdus bovienii]MDE9501329.1 hypothetical protein [Xenorhabdus bovienii]MDE9525055.1 hypothetical protein [Xenorhabdus bovienii]